MPTAPARATHWTWRETCGSWSTAGSRASTAAVPPTPTGPGLLPGRRGNCVGARGTSTNRICAAARFCRLPRSSRWLTPCLAFYPPPRYNPRIGERKSPVAPATTRQDRAGRWGGNGSYRIPDRHRNPPATSPSLPRQRRA